LVRRSAFFGTHVAADIEEVESAITAAENFVMPFAFVRLVEFWNTMSTASSALDVASYIDQMKAQYFDEVQGMNN
jgi:hypothetical protein